MTGQPCPGIRIPCSIASFKIVRPQILSHPRTLPMPAQTWLAQKGCLRWWRGGVMAGRRGCRLLAVSCRRCALALPWCLQRRAGLCFVACSSGVLLVARFRAVSLIVSVCGARLWWCASVRLSLSLSLSVCVFVSVWCWIVCGVMAGFRLNMYSLCYFVLFDVLFFDVLAGFRLHSVLTADRSSVVQP